MLMGSSRQGCPDTLARGCTIWNKVRNILRCLKGEEEQDIPYTFFPLHYTVNHASPQLGSLVSGGSDYNNSQLSNSGEICP